MKKQKSGVSKKGISKRGSSECIFDNELCNIIRKRLNLDAQELPNQLIKKVILNANTAIAEWIVDNPEGFMLPNSGQLSVSKHLPKELRESLEDDIEKIKGIEVSELRRQQLFKRYSIDVGRRVDINQLFEYQKLIPHANLHSYFYTYKVMWFNHRNCKARKSIAYMFHASPKLNKNLHEKVIDGKDYYEWNFTDFYLHKIKPKW